MSAVTAETVYRFGAHCLVPRQSLLLSGTEPVRIGARAFAILVALVERAGTVVASEDLQWIAWSGVVVPEANLRMQVGILRKLLNDEPGKQRVIETVPRRGYRFVMPVERSPMESAPQQPRVVAVQDELPAVPTTIVGRDETIEMLTQALGGRRLLTITGPGGVGKTTVALAVARKCMRGYRDGVRFVDFAAIADSRLVPVAIAAAIGMAVLSEDLVASLIVHLDGKRLLLVLDTCEHVIEPVTFLAEKLLANLPEIQILATSRETLRACGEWVHRLEPLAVPPDEPSLRAAAVSSYPAAELFIQRVAAAADGVELRDCDAPLVSRICRQLDGIPLALELAAAHVDEMGIREVAARLGDRFSILTRGRRTAVPRQQTLAASLQWSYDLLSAQERAVLRRLCVFRGPFTAEAARAVTTDDIEKYEARAALSNLHAKSFLTADIGNEPFRYCLLDTTRCFATEKAVSTGNWPVIQRRHASFVLETMCCAEWEYQALAASTWTARYGYLIEDVRGALEWAFCADGDLELAVRLTAVSAPLWSALALLEEYRRYVERSLASVAAGVPAEPESMLTLWGARGHVSLKVYADLASPVDTLDCAAG
jgi:predicted ATPase/DNA-binding winged helix-turn-helix (wHTH) protein